MKKCNSFRRFLEYNKISNCGIVSDVTNQSDFMGIFVCKTILKTVSSTTRKNKLPEYRSDPLANYYTCL